MSVEQDRRAVLDDLSALDAPFSPRSSDLASVLALVAAACQTPVALVNLFHGTNQHTVAAHGTSTSMCELEDSLCWQVRDDPGTVIVLDTLADPRFAENAHVIGELGRVRFYASHPLVTSHGVMIGRLCVLDERPRTAAEVETTGVSSLDTVATRVVEVLEIGRRLRELAADLERVEELRESVQASHDRLSAFAGQISHDLKTPLSSVSMSLDLICDAVLAAEPDLEDLRWLARKARSGAQRMATLVDDVLTYALVGGADQHTRVDLGTVLAQVLDDLADDLASARVEVGELPVVRGDHTQLRSLLQNLLGNAAKYRHPERRLALSIEARRVGPCWGISVRDNGRGIDPVDARRVFEPLVRADHSVGGTGIGLATCRRIVEAHGGTIGLDGVPGEGCTAWFELPAA